MTQRRKTKRTARRFAVSLGGKLPALALDVSAEGFRVELPQVFLPGSVVHGFVLEGERALPFRGQVAWARPGNPQLSVLSEMGVQFEALSPELQSLVAPPRRSRRTSKRARTTQPA